MLCSFVFLHSSSFFFFFHLMPTHCSTRQFPSNRCLTSCKDCDKKERQCQWNCAAVSGCSQCPWTTHWTSCEYHKNRWRFWHGMWTWFGIDCNQVVHVKFLIFLQCLVATFGSIWQNCLTCLNSPLVEKLCISSTYYWCYITFASFLSKYID